MLETVTIDGKHFTMHDNHNVAVCMYSNNWQSAEIEARNEDRLVH